MADTPVSQTSWQDVATNLLHYIAGGALLFAVGYLAAMKLVEPQVFVTFATAAAGGIGFKIGGK